MIIQSECVKIPHISQNASRGIQNIDFASYFVWIWNVVPNFESKETILIAK
jgi:hypothetical protein